MVTTKDIRFIVINKQEDPPTELEMKGRLHGATQFEEFIMPNGDIIVACEDIKLNARDMPVNLKTIDMYRQQTTGFGEAIHGHCYLWQEEQNRNLKLFL